MYQIIDKRGTGKTSRLMLLAQEHNGIFVCANPYGMREKAKNYGFSGFEIVSYQDFLKQNYSYYDKMVFIDELELFVKSLGNKFNNLNGYSLSLEGD